jgi:tRNA (guanine37-N1)-methyltransferase
MADYDILGNIAIIKGEGKTEEEKLRQAEELLKMPSIKTVLERATNVKGRLRTIKTRFLAGENNLVAEHKENGCIFRFNVETCYFSPRLSNERKLIAEKIKKSDRLLVMFAGVGVFPIVIYKYKKPKKITAIEISKECCKYFKENIRLNKISPYDIEIIQGDVKKKVSKELGKFDVIIMARPNLKETFLKYGLIASQKGTRIFYHGFCRDEELNQLTEQLKKEASKLKRKIQIKDVVPIGEIAPFKHRYRIEINVVG